MIDKKLLEILVCPKDHVPLVLAEPALLTKINRAIAAGRVKNEAGRTVAGRSRPVWFAKTTRCCIRSLTTSRCYWWKRPFR